MKKILFCLITIVGTFLISSCSVEKRLHLPGYHVERVNYHPKRICVSNKPQDLIIKNKDIESVSLTKDIIITEKLNATKTPSFFEEELITSTGCGKFLHNFTWAVQTFNTDKINSHIGIKPSTSLSLTELFFNNYKSDSKYIKEIANVNQSRRVHWGSIISFSSGILGILIANYILIAAYIFGTSALIFSAIALSTINEKPNIYKGAVLARLGLILGFVTIVGYSLLYFI